MKYKCPKCGETENLHFNYDYTKQTTPVLDVLCNECGEFFGEKQQTFSMNDDKRSSHWLDSLAWVRKVYFSCQTKEQEDAAERLLLNFERLHKNEDLITLSWAIRDEYLKFKYQKK